MESIGILLGLVLVIFVVWAQLRTADNTAKILKLLEKEVSKK
jgi:hypothetical protein